MLLVPTRLAIVVCTHLVPFYSQGRRMGVPEMEERFNINPRTLNPALRALVHAGVLNSRTGGNDRGYILARDPRKISLYEIVRTIQGEPKVECCMESLGCTNCEAARPDGSYCTIYAKLKRVLEVTRRELGRITLYEQYYNRKER